jgi:hypothetical protein
VHALFRLSPVRLLLIAPDNGLNRTASLIATRGTVRSRPPPALLVALRMAHGCGIVPRLF